MQYAIIHTATRVIRRLTTDEPPAVWADETAVALAEKIDLAPEGQTKYWKLDDKNKKIAASNAEIDAAGVDETLEAQKRAAKVAAYKDAVATAAADPLIIGSLKTYFEKLKDLI